MWINKLHFGDLMPMDGFSSQPVVTTQEGEYPAYGPQEVLDTGDEGAFQLRPIAGLHSAFYVSFDDRGAFFTDTSQRQGLPVGGRNAVPQKMQKVRVVRKNDDLQKVLTTAVKLIDRVVPPKPVHAAERVVKHNRRIGAVCVQCELRKEALERLLFRLQCSGGRAA